MKISPFRNHRPENNRTQYMIISPRIILSLSAAAVVYFGLLFPVAILLGVAPEQQYYDFVSIKTHLVVWVILLNLVYTISIILSFKIFINREIGLEIISSWWILSLLGLLTTYNLLGNWELSRSEIKSASGVISVAISSVAYCYLGAVLMCDRDRAKRLVSASLLIIGAIYSFERETLLYIIIPLALRVRNRRQVIRTISLVMISVVIVSGYKYLMILARTDGISIESLSEIGFFNRVGASLLLDTMHKNALEIFYFNGFHPIYTELSYLLPVQLLRLYDDTAMSNGNIASQFYTAGLSGTGFSPVLEAWLNARFLGVVVMPVLSIVALRAVLGTKSAMLTLAYLVFFIKLQRSDFWPAFISLMLFPLILYLTAKILFGGHFATKRGSWPVQAKADQTRAKINLWHWQ